MVNELKCYCLPKILGVSQRKEINFTTLFHNNNKIILPPSPSSLPKLHSNMRYKHNLRVYEVVKFPTS